MNTCIQWAVGVAVFVRYSSPEVLGQSLGGRLHREAAVPSVGAYPAEVRHVIGNITGYG